MTDRSIRHSGWIAASLLLAGACVAPPAAKPDVRLVERAEPSMGTELRLSAWTADEPGAAAAFSAVFEEMDRLEDLLSNWVETSDIRRLNSAAGVSPVPVSPDTLSALQIALQVSEWTGGKFDVTFGALSGVWKFDYQDKDGVIPDSREVARRLPLIDYRDLALDEKKGTAFLRRSGMVVNVGGVGKGYAVDRARDILLRQGLRDFMIQFGGDLYVAGKANGRLWRLGIQDPRGSADHVFATVDLTDRTFSTSGDYERFFIKDGQRYHHILDPDTGQPATGCRSVTIVARDAALADGLSTGVFILGPEAGMALIERLEEVEGVIVDRNNHVLVSSGLKDRLTLLASPTDAP